MHNIKIGTTGDQRLLVTTDVTISFLGIEDARVLSTPHLIGYLERTARDTVLPLLEKGYDTVGTHVNVSHLAAAPIGSVVTFRSEITEVQDRRVQFKVMAKTDEEVIGEGTHERAIINVAKFATRIAEKKAKL